MQLIINTYGAYIHVKEEVFELKVNSEKKHVSPKKVQSILITTGATISSDAIKLAVENNIDILFIDHHGEPYGRVWHDRLGSTARIRQKQLELSGTDKGINIGIDFVIAKFNNQIEWLNDLRGKRTRQSAEITSAIAHITEASSKLTKISGQKDARSTIMGIEGSAARQYWSVLSLMLPERFRFKGRSRNPALDEFNCLLNYADGVLYGIVERSCVLAGVDPYVGFIHTDHYAKTSMVFDVIEGYRIFAELSVMKLFSGKKVNKKLFDPFRKGLTLNKEGKTVLLTELNEYLSTPKKYKGRMIKRRDTIQFDLHQLANSWIKKDRPKVDKSGLIG